MKNAVRYERTFIRAMEALYCGRRGCDNKRNVITPARARFEEEGGACGSLGGEPSGFLRDLWVHSGGDLMGRRQAKGRPATAPPLLSMGWTRIVGIVGHARAV